MIRMRDRCTTAGCHTMAPGNNAFEDGKVPT